MGTLESPNFSRTKHCLCVVRTLAMILKGFLCSGKIEKLTCNMGPEEKLIPDL
jgi:hypothetical protein